MISKNHIQVFEDKKLRTLWDSENEKWYISVIDVIEVLTDSNTPKRYWSDLKRKLKKEGNETYEKIVRLKMKAADGITKAWADKTTKEYKILKGLKKENLRDNMTNTELILNMLAEASAKDISEAVQPENFEQSKQGGNVAKVARKELETKTGKKVASPLNVKNILDGKNTKQLKDNGNEK